MAPLLTYLTYLAILPALALTLAIDNKSIRTEGLYHPNGIHTTAPRISWRLTSSTRGDDQSAYQVQVFTTPQKLAAGTPDLWDSGKVASSALTAAYAGAALKSRDIGWFRVRVWDKAGVATGWSDTNTFEMGLLSSSDWSAQWITNPAYVMGTNSLPMFAKPFSIGCPIVAGRLYVIGMGLHSASINGEAVSNEVLAPGDETITKRLVYSSYNVTTLLGNGANVLGVELGKGQYDPEPALGGRYMKYTKPPQPLKLFGQLEYVCQDGSRHTVPTDTSWVTTTNGPLIESSWYGGEEYDARKEIPNWDSAAGTRSGWVNASGTTAPTSAPLVGPASPPLMVTETINAVSITAVGTSWIVDLGVNIAGWYQISVTGTPGTRMIIHPGELLQSNGSVLWYPSPPVWDAYTIGASGAGTYTQKFMYHGFRYLQIDGLPNKPVSVKGFVIRTTNDAVGTFSCSNTLFNQIHTIVDRAIKGNMYSTMTDCPHREKLGWLEQAHLVYDPVAFGYDVQAFGKQMVRLIADTQLPTGLVPDIAPEFTVFSGGFRDDPNWGNTAIMMPLQLYRTYGEIDLLNQNYAMMQRYLDYLTSKSSGYLLDYGLGDWIAFDGSTPTGVTATFGYQQAVNAMITIATALGKTSDASTYKTLEQNILTAFHAKYFNTTTNAHYNPNSQATNAIALDMNAVPSQHKPAVLNTLVDLVTANANKVSVGEIALPSLFRALQDGGRNDLLHTMMTQTANPSYGYQVTHGATSLTENWDGPTSGNSQNHFMLGYGDKWLVELAGVSQAPGSAGWGNITYKPLVVGTLTSAKSTFRSPRGAADGSWSKSSSVFTYDIQVPVGATGTVYLPGTTNAKEGGAAIAGRPGVISVTTSGGQTIVTVGSGAYSFTVG